MGFSNITLSLSQEIIQFLETVDNKSEFVREAIVNKMGRREKSLTEMAILIIEKSNELQTLEVQYDDLLSRVLEHKEQLKLSEIQEYESKMEKKLTENAEFLAKWSPILIEYPEVTSMTKEQTLETTYMTEVVSKIRGDGHRVGIDTIRKYFRLNNPIQPIPQNPTIESSCLQIDHLPVAD